MAKTLTQVVSETNTAINLSQKMASTLVCAGMGSALPIKLCVPVGGIMEGLPLTNPSSVYPMTTWTVVCQGRFKRGCPINGTVLATGGIEWVNLTIDNIPTHSHTETPHTHTRGSQEIFGNAGSVDTHYTSALPSGAFAPGDYGYDADSRGSGSGWWGVAFDASRTWSGASSANSSGIGHAGLGERINVLNPFEVYVIWMRLT